MSKSTGSLPSMELETTASNLGVLLFAAPAINVEKRRLEYGKYAKPIV
jgi:hypothetical protein